MRATPKALLLAVVLLSAVVSVTLALKVLGSENLKTLAEDRVDDAADFEEEVDTNSFEETQLSAPLTEPSGTVAAYPGGSVTAPTGATEMKFELLWDNRVGSQEWTFHYMDTVPMSGHCTASGKGHKVPDSAEIANVFAAADLAAKPKPGLPVSRQRFRRPDMSSSPGPGALNTNQLSWVDSRFSRHWCALASFGVTDDSAGLGSWINTVENLTGALVSACSTCSGGAKTQNKDKKCRVQAFFFTANGTRATAYGANFCGY